MGTSMRPPFPIQVPGLGYRTTDGQTDNRLLNASSTCVGRGIKTKVILA